MALHVVVEVLHVLCEVDVIHIQKFTCSLLHPRRLLPTPFLLVLGPARTTVAPAALAGLAICPQTASGGGKRGLVGEPRGLEVLLLLLLVIHVPIHCTHFSVLAHLVRQVIGLVALQGGGKSNLKRSVCTTAATGCIAAQWGVGVVVVVVSGAVSVVIVVVAVPPVHPTMWCVLSAIAHPTRGC